MDHPNHPLGPSCLPLQGPHRHRLHESPLPPGFYPLRLVLQPGGMVVELTRAETFAGRHSDSDIRLPMPDVSRRHCRFVFDAGDWHVVDLKSLNGVSVNGEFVVRSILRHGDEVKIGGFTFRVDLETGAKAAQASITPPRKSANVLQNIADSLPTLTPDSSYRRAA